MNKDWMYDTKISHDLEQRSFNKSENEISECWDRLIEKYKIGDKIKGVIFIKAPFGMFVDIGEIKPALLETIHIKDLDYEGYLNNKCYLLGNEIVAKLIHIEKESRQIRLSLL